MGLRDRGENTGIFIPATYGRDSASRGKHEEKRPRRRKVGRAERRRVNEKEEETRVRPPARARKIRLTTVPLARGVDT